MMQALYTGMHGMFSHQQNIDIIANNVSNVNTNGFRRSRGDFRETLYATMQNPVTDNAGLNLQRGTGVALWQTARDFRQGAPAQSGRPLDFLLESGGFFAVEGLDGATRYTRDGAFYLSSESGGQFLVNKAGEYVLDDARRRIAISENVANLSVSEAGDFSILSESGEVVPLGVRLGVFGFTNQNGLDDVGAGMFAETVNSGTATLAASPTVRQGSLESSNVDYAEEATRLIRSQRAYQLSSRCVSVVDQMQQLCNTIRA
jgi:flagellar basal-body rod protein FlgG